MINLLPPQYKEELLLEERRRLVIILGSLFFFFLISFILILLPIKIYLDNQVIVQKTLLDFQRKEKESSEIEKMEKKIEIINQKLKLLDNFYQKQLHLSQILEKINQALPSGVYLTNFSFSKGTLEISLAGFSPTRENLKQFQRNLAEIFQKKEIREIDVPIANWVEAKDIDFSGINFKLK